MPPPNTVLVRVLTPTSCSGGGLGHISFKCAGRDSVDDVLTGLWQKLAARTSSSSDSFRSLLVGSDHPPDSSWGLALVPRPAQGSNEASSSGTRPLPSTTLLRDLVAMAKGAKPASAGNIEVEKQKQQQQQPRRLECLSLRLVPPCSSSGGDDDDDDLKLQELTRSSSSTSMPSTRSSTGSTGSRPTHHQLAQSHSTSSIPSASANTKGLDKSHWVPDSAAPACQNPKCAIPFTFFVRRHHCRNCGRVFCHSCTLKKCRLIQLDISTPQRVCDECFRLEVKNLAGVLSANYKPADAQSVQKLLSPVLLQDSGAKTGKGKKSKRRQAARPSADGSGGRRGGKRSSGNSNTSSVERLVREAWRRALLSSHANVLQGALEAVASEREFKHAELGPFKRYYLDREVILFIWTELFTWLRLKSEEGGVGVGASGLASRRLSGADGDSWAASAGGAGTPGHSREASSAEAVDPYVQAAEREADRATQQGTSLVSARLYTSQLLDVLEQFLAGALKARAVEAEAEAEAAAAAEMATTSPAAVTRSSSSSSGGETDGSPRRLARIIMRRKNRRSDSRGGEEAAVPPSSAAVAAHSGVSVSVDGAAEGKAKGEAGGVTSDESAAEAVLDERGWDSFGPGEAALAEEVMVEVLKALDWFARTRGRRALQAWSLKRNGGRRRHGSFSNSGPAAGGSVPASPRRSGLHADSNEGEGEGGEKCVWFPPYLCFKDDPDHVLNCVLAPVNEERAMYVKNRFVYGADGAVRGSHDGAEGRGGAHGDYGGGAVGHRRSPEGSLVDGHEGEEDEQHWELAFLQRWGARRPGGSGSRAGSSSSSSGAQSTSMHHALDQYGASVSSRDSDYYYHVNDDDDDDIQGTSPSTPELNPSALGDWANVRAAAAAYDEEQDQDGEEEEEEEEDAYAALLRASSGSSSSSGGEYKFRFPGGQAHAPELRWQYRGSEQQYSKTHHDHHYRHHQPRTRQYQHHYNYDDEEEEYGNHVESHRTLRTTYRWGSGDAGHVAELQE